MIHSLNGLRILNTRPKAQAEILTQYLVDAGGIVIECPTIAIKETDSTWVSTLPDLAKIHHAIFISPNAAHFCFKQLKSNHISWPPHINVIAIGQATANALKEHHLLCNDIPPFPNSEHLLTLKSLKHLDHQTVLLFKGKGGRDLIEECLSKRGATVLVQSIYERAMPKIDPLLIQTIWQNDQVDIILLTSEQSIHNLFALFGKDALQWLQSKTFLVISERLAQSASLFGIQKIVKSHPERMINTLFDYSQGLIHDPK